MLSQQQTRLSMGPERCPVVLKRMGLDDTQGTMLAGMHALPGQHSTVGGAGGDSG